MAVGGMTMDQIPTLSVYLSRSKNGGYWRWTTLRCELCGGGPHIHGGGRVIEDPRRRLSYRAAHCDPRILKMRGRTSINEYELKDADPERTERMIAEARS
jgi:hypothetical protein